jgi:hypothetical protein
MALAKKKCRVCGKQYEACRSSKRKANVFVWREVACSYECGGIYLEQVIASRTVANDIKDFVPAVADEPAVEKVGKNFKNRNKTTQGLFEPTDETIDMACGDISAECGTG